MNAEVATGLDPDELRPGTSLLEGRVQITQRIGRGGMSTIYAATDRGRTVAVKLVASAYAGDPNVSQRFRNEARIGQALADHPRVATPYEVGEVPELGGRLYITMPLVRGTPLSMMADRHEWKRWVAVVADLSRTVADLHSRGIIHRDIKPGNVILSAREGQEMPYLLDFGAAYSTGDGQVPTTAGLTRSDECPGTKLYMAPEQALGHVASPSFDVYALALSLYELLAGVHPLQGMTPAEAVRRKCSRELPPLSLRNHRPELPDALLDAVDRGLEREPERRTPTALLFAESLEKALRSTSVAPVKEAMPAAGSAGAATAQARRYGGTETSVVMTDAEKRSVESPGDAQYVPCAVADERPRRGMSLWIGVVAAVLFVAVALAMWPKAPPGSSQARTQTPVRTVIHSEEPEGSHRALDAEILGASAAVPVMGSGSGGAPTQGETDAVASSDPPPAAKPDLGKQRSPKPKGRSKKRHPSTPECVAARQQAEAASGRNDPKGVLRATKHAKCWADPGVRRLLRVKAFYALGDHQACVKAAKNASDTRTRRTAQLCKAALPDGRPPAP